MRGNIYPLGAAVRPPGFRHTEQACKSWRRPCCREFNRGRSMLTDKFKEGRPKSVVVPQNIDAVRELTTQDRHVTYHEIKAFLGTAKKSASGTHQQEEKRGSKDKCTHYPPGSTPTKDSLVRYRSFRKEQASFLEESNIVIGRKKSVRCFTAGNAPVTPLGSLVSLGYGDHPVSNGSPTCSPLAYAIKNFITLGEVTHICLFLFPATYISGLSFQEPGRSSAASRKRQATRTEFAKQNHH
ncbi:hypothetical protein EVAR_62689_1 [Eumeta japonica]|uniref:Uncharacterized protein n=1 Tax=Eumeta variegata TaxID=151549 RepID=A0A4C1ZW26_EUMVA|nr:hypothetical protein EVAR_62689_1 [Eumeta japonica]